MATPAAPEPLRIVVVDADARVRECLGDLIGLADGIDVTGSAAHAAEAFEAAVASGADAVVLDPRLPDVDDGLALIARLREHLPHLTIVVTSWSDDLEQPAISRGADAFVPKSIAANDIAEAVVVAARRTGRAEGGVRPADGAAPRPGAGQSLGPGPGIVLA